MSEREEYLDELLKGIDADSADQPGGIAEEGFLESYSKELEGIDEEDFLRDFEKSLGEELDFDMEEELSADTEVDEEEPLADIQGGGEEELSADIQDDGEEELENNADDSSISSNFMDDIDNIVSSVKSNILEEDSDEGDLSIEESLMGYAEEEPTLDEIGQGFANHDSEPTDTPQEENNIMDMLSNMPGIEDLEEMKETDEDALMAEALAQEIEGLDLEMEIDHHKEGKVEEVVEPQSEEMQTEEKRGFFSRLSLLLFGPDEEAAKGANVSGDGTGTLEGQSISQEEEEEAKKKQKKAEKKALKEEKAKERKEKNAEKKTQKQQLAKEKAEKKAVMQKEQKPVQKSKPLPKKPVVLIMLFGLSVVVLINLLSSLIGYNTALSDAKENFAQGKYVEAYACVSEMDIKSADEELYNKVRLNAYLQREINSYEAYQGQSMYREALGALICGVGRYDRFIKDAEKAGIEKDYKKMLQKIEASLSNDYQMSMDKAREIYALDEKREFTYAVYDVISELGLEEEP